ncbi:MAG: integration host factor subunit alpha [Burkholderiales bacterium]|nr:integration host factor subunit alpha [Burkholderiales bacterium]
MSTVTKNELIQVVMENSELSRMDAYRLVEDFFDVMTKSLEDGDEVKVSGFGNFVLRDKKPRIGRNPKTKEEFPISARRVVSFHTSNLLKDQIKDYQPE